MEALRGGMAGSYKQTSGKLMVLLHDFKARLFEVHAEATEGISDSPQSKVTSWLIVAWLYLNMLSLCFMPNAKFLGSSYALSLTKALNIFDVYPEYLTIFLLCYVVLCLVLLCLALHRKWALKSMTAKSYLILAFFLKHFLHFPVLRMSSYWLQATGAGGSNDGMTTMIEAASPLLLLFTLLLEWLFTLFCYSPAIFESELNVLDRSSSTVQVKILWQTILLPFAYNYTSLVAYEIYLLIYFAICANIALDFWRYLPYQLLRTNVAVGGAFVVGAWAVVCQVLGLFSESDLVVYLLLLLVSPLMILIYHDALKHRLDTCKITSADNINLTNLKLRRQFEDYVASESSVSMQLIRDTFKAATNSEGSTQLLSLWECLYYLKVEKENELAQVKIAKCEYFSWDLEAQFHIRKFDLTNRTKLFVPEIDYLIWISYLTRAQDCERSYCHAYISFCDALLFGDKFDRIYKLCTESSTCLAKTKRIYAKLCKKFPTEATVKKYYGTFLVDLLFDNRGLIYLNQNETHLNANEKIVVNRITSIFEEDTGVLVVGGGKHTAGKILYSNERAAVMLNTEVLRIIGEDLDSFIPPPHNVKHNLKLMNLIKYANYSKFTRTHIVLLDASHRLIEVVLSIKALSFKLDAYFLVGFRQKPIFREVAVYIRRMQGYVITAHSAGFAMKLFGLNNCENVLLEDVMPGLTRYLDTYGQNYPFVYREKHVMMFTETSIGASPISMLYFCYSTNSLADFVQAGLIAEEAVLSLNDYFQDTNPQRNLLSQEAGLKTQLSAAKDKQRIPQSEPLLNGVTIQRQQASSLSRNTSQSSSIERHKINRSMTSMKWFVSLLIILVVGMVMTFVFYLSGLLDQLQDRLLFEQLGRTLLGLARIGRTSRTAELTAEGLLQGNSAELSQALEGLSKSLYSNITYIKDNSKGYAIDAFQSHRTEDLVTSWEYVSSYSARQDSLYNTLSTVAARADSLSTYSENLGDTSDFRYLYRNCFGEAFRAMNSTNNELINAELDHRTNMLGVIQLSQIFGVVGCVIGYIVVMIVFTLCVERHLRSIWDKVLSLDRVFLLQGKTDYIDRLRLFLDTDYEDPQDSIKVKRSKKSFCHSKVMVLKMLVLVPLIVLQLVITYFYFFDPIANEFVMMPVLYSYIAEQQAVSEGIAYWAREIYLDDVRGESYLEIVETSRMGVSPLVELEALVSRSDQLGRKIFSKQYSFGNSHFANIREIPIQDTCIAQFTDEECTKSGILAGFSAALREFLHLTYDFIESAKDGQSLEKYTALVDRLSLHDKMLQYIADKLLSNVKDNSDAIHANIILVTIGFSATYFLLLFVLFIPHINGIMNEIKLVSRVLKIRA
jgi:hypothetical protein